MKNAILISVLLFVSVFAMSMQSVGGSTPLPDPSFPALTPSTTDDIVYEIITTSTVPQPDNPWESRVQEYIVPTGKQFILQRVGAIFIGPAGQARLVVEETGTGLDDAFPEFRLEQPGNITPADWSWTFAPGIVFDAGTKFKILTPDSGTYSINGFLVNE